MKTFREAVQSDTFTLTAELTLTRESAAGDVQKQARLLGGHVDAIQVTDNPWAWVQMSSLAAARLVLDAGFDAVPVMTCRDRNRIALHSDLLGLRALGVSSVLLMRGHRIPKDHATPAGMVFDIGGRELIKLASDMTRDEKLGAGAGFFIGTGAKVFRPKRGWRAESLGSRAGLGAQFMQTQLCFNVAALKLYMQRLVDARMTWNYSVIVSLTPLPSAEIALWLKQNLRDSLIPDALVKRLEQAKDPEQEGVTICAETLQQIAEIPGISGAHVMTTGDPETIPAAIAESGLRKN